MINRYTSLALPHDLRASRRISDQADESLQVDYQYLLLGARAFHVPAVPIDNGITSLASMDR